MKIPMFLVLTLCAFCARARVVTLDFDQVLTGYAPTRAADQELQQRIEAFRRDQQQDVAAYQELQQEFVGIREQAANLGLEEERRQALASRGVEIIEQIRGKEQELQQKQQAFQKEIEDQRRRMRQRLTDEIRERLGVLAKERGWEMVLDRGAVSPNGTPVVLHATVAIDVTAEVLRELNNPTDEPQAGNP